MADYSNIKSFLGKKEDTVESPYSSYDEMIRQAQREAQLKAGERAMDFYKKNPDMETPVKQSQDSPFLGSISKANPQLGRELETIRYGQDAKEYIDRNDINSELVNRLLRTVNPTIPTNIKYGSKDRGSEQYDLENEDTQKHIYAEMKPRLEKLLGKTPESEMTKSPEMVDPEDVIIGGKTMSELDMMGLRNDKTGDILLNKYDVRPTLTSIVPHEIMHGLLPSSEISEETPNFINTPSNELRQQLAKAQNKHIDTSRLVDNDIEAPQGESAVYWRLAKELANRGK